MCRPFLIILLFSAPISAAHVPEAHVIAHTAQETTIAVTLPLSSAIWADTVTFSCNLPDITITQVTNNTETSERYDTSRAKTRATLAGTAHYTLACTGALPTLTHLQVLYLTTEYLPEYVHIPVS